MKYKQLGSSALQVSEICLGTMTWGQQNSMAEAHAQLDYAIGQGINFIDTAEMYSAPPRAETQGRTEEYLGSWLKRQQRDKIIVATKVAGPRPDIMYLRNGPRLERAQINAAIDASLKRLQTDYVDLYQIHWPDRNVPLFGAWQFDPAKERATVPIREQLEAMGELVKAGKIRYLGLSNETPWGTMEFARLARELNLPRVVSMQNAYNLLNRVFEYGMAEVCFREQIALMPYSLLGFGHLSGKYLSDPNTKGRLTQFPSFGQRYTKVNTQAAVKEYVMLAQRLGISPATLAQAFVKSRSFVTSAIIGATNVEQLKENIRAFDAELSAETLQEIDAIHLRYTNPAP
jgi:aryl-alcohol dehydrogenase-like predicted oxidoreductase